MLSVSFCIKVTGVQKQLQSRHGVLLCYFSRVDFVKIVDRSLEWAHGFCDFRLKYSFRFDNRSVFNNYNLPYNTKSFCMYKVQVKADILKIIPPAQN